MNDGAVVFDTRLNNKQLEKDYAQAVKKLDRLGSDLNSKKEKENSVSVQLEDVTHRADEARNHIKMLKEELSAIDAAMAPGSSPNDFIEAHSRKPIMEAALQEAEKQLEPLVKESDKLSVKLEKCKNEVNDAAVKFENQRNAAARISSKIDEANAALKEQKNQAEKVTEEFRESAKGASGLVSVETKLEETTDDTAKRLDKLGKRFAQLAASALVFSVVTKGLTMMRAWLGEVVTKNDQTAASIARLKGALLTLAQPLLNVVIPVFTTLVNLLTAIIGKVAAFLSMLGGKTVKESTEAAKALNKQADAYGSAGDAAEEAQKQLMGFDEINKLEDTSTGSGGGGSGSGEIAPDFSWSDGITETLDRIADLVLLIAAGLALWKISQYIPGQLGTILGNLGLILAALGGVLIFLDGFRDAWENGVDWGNMAEMVLGLAVAAGALYAAFGPVAAGITLIAGGLAMLVAGFRDAMENGFNLENTLLSIAGIIATGLGITLLTGSLIPLLIAAIASLLLAFTVATGNGEELIAGLKATCQGFLDFFSGIFSSDMDKVMEGLKTMFSGLKQAGSAMLSGLKDAMLAFLSWLNDATGGAVNSVISLINGMIAVVCDGWNALASLLSIDIPGVVSISLPQFTSIPQIPYLAEGAVIPPNREFLAVLGDQTHGNNIEAPEDLIRQIVREESGGDGRVAQLLEILIATVEGIEVGDEVIGRAASRYNRRVSRAGGY